MYTVLYVDDEPGLLQIGKLFLEERGQFIIDTVTSAPSALTLLDTKNYDAIVSDFQMPDMDGIEFLKKVRKSGSNIPYILFTGRGREEIVIQALNEGADFYLQKGGDPVSQFTELEHQIRQAIQQRKAEANIRDLERREADIINFLPDATCVIDRSGHIIAWNRAIEEMTGVPAADMLGKGDYEYAIPFYEKRQPVLIDLVFESDEVIAKKYAHIVHKKDILIADTTLSRLKGKPVTLMGMASPLYNRQGEVIGAIESIRDITERQLAENAVRASEEKYRTLVENVVDIIYRADCDGNLVFVTPSILPLIDYDTLDEIIGHPITSFWAYPKKRDDLIARMKEKGYVKDYEVILLKRDGTEIPVSVSSHFYYDDTGRIAGVEGIIHDITERKKAEGALRESEERYRTLLQRSFDAVVVHRNGIITRANQGAATLVGASSSSELIGKKVLDFVHPAYRNTVQERIAAMISGNEMTAVDAIEEKFLRIDGKAIDVEVVATNFLDEGQPAIQVVFRDITERKRGETYRQLSLEVLGLLNEPGEFSGILGKVLDAIKKVTSADAVGIRLRAGDDFPYFVQSGFPGGFLLKENTLLEQDQDGRICRDANGNARWECTCGLVVSGKIDPDNPLFTPGGSFWTNNSFPLLELPATEDPRYHPRNTCVHEGYASVALVPIRTMKHQVIGVLQVNAFKKNCFTLDAIQGLELIAGHIGEALLRWQAQEALHESEKRYRTTLNQASDSIIIHDLSGRIVDINRKTVENLGYTKDELRSMTIADIDPDAMVTGKDRSWENVLQGKGVTFESCHKRKDGSTFPVEVTLGRVDLDTGTHVIGIVRDITERRNNEAALRESEERYRNVVEDQTEFISRFLPDGTHVFVNEAYCRYFGLNRDGILGHRFRPRIPAEDRERVSRFFASLTKEHPVGDIRHRIIMPDGQVRWQQWSDRAIFDEKENIIEYQSVGRDITEIIHAEEALHEGREFTSLLLDASPVFYVAIGNDGKTITMNRHLLEALGYSLDEIKGTDYLTTFVPREDREALKEVFSRITEAGTTTINVNRITSKSGRIYLVEWHGRPVKQGAGKQDFFVGVGIDITEKTRAEQALQESEKQYRTLLDKIPELILVHQDGLIRYVNPAATKTLGYLTSEVLNRPLTNFVPPEYHDRIVTASRRRINGETVEPYEIELLGKDRSRRTVIISGSLILFDGAPASLVVLMDITERKQMEEALQQALKKLHMLSSITRHDILNQLIGVRTYHELIKGREKDPELLKLLRKADVSLDAIWEQIDFTRNYENLGVQTPRWQNVAEIFLSATSKLPLGAIAIDVRVSGLEVYADPLIEKVFYNLVENSLRHGGHVTSLVLSAKEIPDGIIVMYRDNGVGIAIENKNKLFQKGFGKHTGLGLFLSREILLNTGITIAETGKPGTGIRFEILVPKGAYRFAQPSANSR